MIMECMISKSIEWSFPLWIISVDMKETFDRIEHSALFEGLARQGIGSSYINVLRRLYDDQKGIIRANVYFSNRTRSTTGRRSVAAHAG